MKPKRKGITIVEVLVIAAILLILGCLIITALCGCERRSNTPKATTGVSKATADVKPQASGLTVEQTNIKRRVQLENAPGAIKHLYVLSAYSGQVVIYSTVKGKVSSSGKRLSPYTVACMEGSYVTNKHTGFTLDIGGSRKATGEVLQDDGTYGHSISYLFWFDAQDRYHQHYVAGGQIVHISDQPLPVKNIILNMEILDNEQSE